MLETTSAWFVAASLLLTVAASAQTPTRTDKPADPQAPAAALGASAPPKSAWTPWGPDFSILVDDYVYGKFNHPDSGINQLRNFDVRAGNVHLSMAKLTIDHAPGPFGFHVDGSLGQTFDIVHSSDHDYDTNKGPARIATGKRWAFAPRAGFFNDIDGFTTGTPQQLKEIRLTGECKLTSWLVSRLEFRNDWSNVPFFDKEGGKTSKTQPPSYSRCGIVLDPTSKERI